MRHRLYAHLTWTTLDRAPLISAKLAEFLTRFLPAMASQEYAGILAIGIVSTHVHLIVRLQPATDISRLVQRLKGGSAAIATREGHAGKGPRLRWAKGYNIESVSPRAIPQVLQYLNQQPLRHPDQVIPGWPPVAVEPVE